jgi:hypothetical protein
MTDPAAAPAPDPLTPAERARVMLAVWHGLGHGAGLSQEEVGALWEVATVAIEAAERSVREACGVRPGECGVLVKGEPCALPAGHAGGHKWANGD